MNKRLRTFRSVFAPLTLLVALAGGCATHHGSIADAPKTGMLPAQAHATFSEIDLQRRQAAVAMAFLSRLDELVAADPHPQDPDHHRPYEGVARHMLARAKARMQRYGVAPLTEAIPETDAVCRVDVRNVESEYARRALDLQREVVRMERANDDDRGDSDAHAEAAVYDLGLILTLRSPMVSVPHNSRSGAGGGGGGSGKVVATTNPKGSTGGVNPPEVEGSGSTAYDDYMKRKGFSSHPGYTPTAK